MPDYTASLLDEESRRFLKIVKDSGRPELCQLPVDQARILFAKGQLAFPVTMPPADVESRTIPIGSGRNLLIYVVRPAGNKSVLPAVMYFHGGGWVVGEFSTHERTVRELACGAQAAVIFPEYSRAPEARFPVANEEAWAATKWVSENGREISVDSGHIAVAGDSAGGNMATMVSIMARERGAPKLSGQILINPSTGGDPKLPSKLLFGQDYYLTQNTSNWFWSHYVGDASQEIQFAACPMHATLEQLTGLPPALVLTAECDPLRDEGEAYARRLMEAGVRVGATRCLGALHGFTVGNAFAQSAASRMALAQMCGFLKEVFGGVQE